MRDIESSGWKSKWAAAASRARMVVISLAVSAVLPTALEAAPKGVFHAHASNAQQATQRVTLNGVGGTGIGTIEAISEVKAGSKVVGPVPDKKKKPTATVRRVTVKDGPKATADIDLLNRPTTSSANSEATLTYVGARAGQLFYIYGMAQSFADVTGKGPVGTAFIDINDPLTFDNVLAGDIVSMSDVFEVGFGLQAQADDGAHAAAEIHASGGTNIPGLESLFSWSLSLDSDEPSNLHFNFRSNPLLNLDDAAIERMLLAAMAFDAASGSYTLLTELTLFDFSVQVPNDMNELALEYETAATVEGVGAEVPEPSTLGLFITGSLGLFGYRWRRFKLPSSSPA